MPNPKHRFAILPKVVAVRILCNIDQSGTAQSQKDVSEGGSGATCLKAFDDGHSRDLAAVFPSCGE